MYKLSPQNLMKNRLQSSSKSIYQQIFPNFCRQINPITNIIFVNNPSQERQLVNNLFWRQKTSMPIVKVLSFQNQSQIFPKLFTVQIQNIKMSVKYLGGLEIQEALYLIQQCLLGVQALSYKYHSFNFSNIFYGINNKGQCKVWIAQNLFQYKSQQFFFPSQDIIINSILKMVQQKCNVQTRLQLKQFIQQIANNFNIVFTNFHLALSQFANRKKVAIPNSILIQKSRDLCLIGKINVELSKKSLQKKNLGLKINFRYESPLPRYLINTNKQQDESQEQSNLLKINKSKITCHSLEKNIKYHLFPLNRSISQKRQSLQNKIVQENKNKQFQNMLLKPNKLKNKIIASKDSIKISPKKQSIDVISSIISYNNQVKSQKTCASLTVNNDSSLMIVQSNVILNQNENNKNDIVGSKTNFTVNQQCAFRISKILQQNDYKNISIQQKNYQKFTKISNYNFGGLLAFPQKSIKQSQNVDISLIFDQNFSQAQFQRQQQKILKSFIIGQDEINYKFNKNQVLWQNKMTRLLVQDPDNLKRSVYQGQENKPQPLQIKLNLLGRLGRQITSLIPQSNE